MISNFLFNFSNFYVIIFYNVIISYAIDFMSIFLPKLLILGILFSTAVNAAFLAKPLGILPYISVIFALQSVFSNKTTSIKIFLF